MERLSWREFVDDIRWRRRARRLASADQRIVLAVALIERVFVPSSPGGNAWHEICNHYLKTLLALDHLLKVIRDAGETTVTQAWGRGEGFSFSQEIVEYSGRNQITVHLEAVANRIDDLLSGVEPETMQARMLEEIKLRLHDGPTALAWLQECEQRVERLLGRARRQRNAVAHGTRTIPDVVASVEPFLDQVAGSVIGALQKSVEDGVDLATQLEGYRTHWARQKAALAAGAAPVAALFSRPT